METREETVSTTIVDKAIGEAEKEYAQGNTLLDAKDVFALLRRKYLG